MNFARLTLAALTLSLAACATEPSKQAQADPAKDARPAGCVIPGSGNFIQHGARACMLCGGNSVNNTYAWNTCQNGTMVRTGECDLRCPQN